MPLLLKFYSILFKIPTTKVSEAIDILSGLVRTKI